MQEAGIQTSTDLKKFIKADRSKGYPAYKDLKECTSSGVCAFHRPCAGRPVRFPVESGIHVKKAQLLDFQSCVLQETTQRIALQDDLTRHFGMLAGKHAFQVPGRAG